MLACVAMLLTLVARSATTLSDSRRFSDRAVTVIHSGAVQSLIVTAVTGRVLSLVGDRPGVQPLISEGVGAALSNPQVTAEIRAAAAALQSQFAYQRPGYLTLTLPALGPSLAAAIATRSPLLAQLVGHVGTVTVLDAPIPPTAGSAMRYLAILGGHYRLLLVLCTALAGLALVVSPARRSTLLGLSLGAIASGLLAAATYAIGRGLVVQAFSLPAARIAAGAAWNAYLAGFQSSGLVLAAAGAAAAVVALLLRALP